jgi:hypothetical protein
MCRNCHSHNPNGVIVNSQGREPREEMELWQPQRGGSRHPDCRFFEA